MSLLLIGSAPLRAQTPVPTLGVASTAVVTILPPGNYTGNYRVLGNLQLTDGTYNISNGTWTVDGYARIRVPSPTPQGRGSFILLAANATVNISGVTFTGGCCAGGPTNATASTLPFGGIFIMGEPGITLTMSNSVMRYGGGVIVSLSSYSSSYVIKNTLFDNCAVGFCDLGRHVRSELPAGQYPCVFTDNTIRSQYGQVGQPYYSYPYGDPSYETLYAIRMEVDGSAIPSLGEYDVDLRNNAIDGAVYGILANLPGKGSYLLDGQKPILNVRRIGLWLDRDAVQLAAPNAAPVKVSFRGTARAATGQTSANDQQYGVFGDYSQYDTPYSVSGSGGTDTVANKAQTGVYFSNASRTFSQSAFQNLTIGIRLRGGSGDVAANTFINCGAGVRVRANTALNPNFNLWCNSFNNTANTANVRAIWLENGARLNPVNRVAYVNEELPVNAPPQPAGNRFVNYANGTKPFVFNGNTSAVLNYIRFDGSVDEPAGMRVDRPAPLPSQAIPNSGISISPTNNCATRIQPTAGAQQRGSALSAAADEQRIQALMDTLRRLAAPPQRLGYYQNEIRAYFFAQGRQADLEAYVLTLANANPAAYFALGMEVLGHYRRERQPADAARLRQSLGTHPQLSKDAALRARLAYYDVVGRLAAARLAPDARPAPADSLALRQLLTSKQAEALEAAQWWALYYTNPVRPAPTMQATSAPPVARSAGSGAAFALYPNPAHRTLSVRYAPALAAKGSAPAEVRLVDLLGGAVRQRTALVGETTAVPLVGLRPGTYACQLYVGGVWQSSQRVVVE